MHLHWMRRKLRTKKKISIWNLPVNNCKRHLNQPNVEKLRKIVLQKSNHINNSRKQLLNFLDLSCKKG